MCGVFQEVFRTSCQDNLILIRRCVQACYSVAAAQRRSRVADGTAVGPGEDGAHGLHLDPAGVQVYGVLEQPDLQARAPRLSDRLLCTGCRPPP